MQLEKEKIEIRLIILNLILWIPLIILLIFIIGISKVEAESYWLNIYHDTSQQSLVDEAPSLPYYYENNALACTGTGIHCPIPVGTISSYFTVINNMDNSHNYNWSFYSVLTYIAYEPITVDTSYMICYYRGTSERIPCNVNIRIYNQTSEDQYITEVIMEWNFENINPNANKTGIQVRLPKVENTKLKKYELTLNNTSFTETQGDQSAAIISANNANTQVIVNNNNENTQEIINNNGANTDRIIETLLTQYDTCQHYNLTNDILSTEGRFADDGSIRIQNPWYYTSNYIPINPNKNYTLAKNYTYSQRYCLYDENKNIIGNCIVTQNTETIINSGNAHYIRYDGQISNSNTNYFIGDFCYNRLDKQNEEIQNLDDHMFVLMGGDFVPDPQPNTTTSDSAFNKEGQILNSIDTDIQLEQFTIDTTSNNLIWEWVHKILFTNTLVSGTIIALLTLGVIKLILGR